MERGTILNSMNNNIFYFFYNLAHKSVFLDKVIIFIAEPLAYFVIVSAIIFVLFHHDIFTPKQGFGGFGVFKKAFLNFKQKWREIVLVFFSSISAWVLAYVLKILFHTSRPFLVLPDVTPLWIESGYAFPSGHATFFMALAVAVYLSHKKAGYVFITFAFLIGLARITAGVHFPIDIFGGFVLGSGVAYLVNYFYFPHVRHVEKV